MLHGLLLVKRNPVYCGAVCRTHVPFLKRLLIAPVGRGDAACRIDSSREKAFWSAPQRSRLPYRPLLVKMQPSQTRRSGWVAIL